MNIYSSVDERVGPGTAHGEADEVDDEDVARDGGDSDGDQPRT
jgi:hypothetical protein